MVAVLFYPSVTLSLLANYWLIINIINLSVSEE